MTPFWLSAFLDFAAEDSAAGVKFWSAVTGFPVSASRGADGEFATLMPPTGDAYLKVQRLRTGPSRIHLDLHVVDPRAATDRAISLGAQEESGLEAAELGYVVLSSPGGLTFCFVTHPGAVRPSPASFPGVRRTMIYQVSLDLPSDSYDAEAAFWASMLVGTPEVLASRPEFSWLRGERQMALDVLVQRLDRASGPVTAHLDLGTPDRAAEVARHVALGAQPVVVEEFWTVLRDPAGLAYCVTDRDPATGRLS